MFRTAHAVFILCALPGLPGVEAATVAAEHAVHDIRVLRAQSNAAIAAHDAAALRLLLADDYYGISGTRGTLDSGAAATAQSYAEDEFRDGTFVAYERSPQRIVIARSGHRAAESGRWVGIWHKPDGTMRKTGIYLAMWLPVGDSWRLKSESFVALDCTGSASCVQAE